MMRDSLGNNGEVFEILSLLSLCLHSPTYVTPDKSYLCVKTHRIRPRSITSLKRLRKLRVNLKLEQKGLGQYDSVSITAPLV